MAWDEIEVINQEDERVNPVLELLRRGATYQKLVEFWEANWGEMVSNPLRSFLEESLDCGVIEEGDDHKYYLRDSTAIEPKTFALSVHSLLPEFDPYSNPRNFDGIGVHQVERLNPHQLCQVVNDIHANQNFHVRLRRNGLEVLCMISGEGKIGYLPAGMIVSGEHIPTERGEDLFAVTFGYDFTFFEGWNTNEATEQFLKAIEPYKRQ